MASEAMDLDLKKTGKDGLVNRPVSNAAEGSVQGSISDIDKTFVRFPIVGLARHVNAEFRRARRRRRKRRRAAFTFLRSRIDKDCESCDHPCYFIFR